MTANRKIRREMNLDEFEEQATDALGSAPGLKLNLRDGESVVIPHPLLVDDDTQEKIERVQKRQDLDLAYPDGSPIPLDDNGFPKDALVGGQPAPTFSVRFAKAVLGEEAHAKFIAGGGTSNKVGLAWQYLTEGLQDPKLPR